MLAIKNYFLAGFLLTFFSLQIFGGSSSDLTSSLGTSGFHEVFEKTSPSVVNISCVKTSPKNGVGLVRQNLGSGIIVSSDGYILTNRHVVDEGRDIQVLLFDQRDFEATIVGVDPQNDLTLLKINATGLTPIPFGNSDQIRVGDWAIAIGSPMQLSNTMTVGIISGKGRLDIAGYENEDLIQTDAAIHPGNSGGPLLNIKGELIGINTAILSLPQGYSGIGFAIPSNLVIKVISDLQTKGRVERGWIGVTLQTLTKDLQSQFKLSNTQGALVTDVIKGSPADMIGIQRGDVITRYQDIDIPDSHYLETRVMNAKISEKVALELIRNHRRIKAFIVIKAVPEETLKSATHSLVIELNVETITPELIQKYHLKRQAGVVITSIQGHEISSDLKVGDIILEIQQVVITSVDDYKKKLEKLTKGERILLTIQRQEAVFFTILNIDYK